MNRISLQRATIVTLGLAGLLSLGACATTPNVLAGHYSSITPGQVQTGRYQGYPVRWGGVIVATEPGKTETCFRMLGTRLGRNEKPVALSRSSFEGRFLACAKGFYEPKLFARGRRVTFVGTINGVKHEKIGKYDYPYPRLKTTVVYLWPRYVPRPQTNYYINGWWAPYGGFNWWPWWGYSTWGAPPPYYYYGDPDAPDDPPQAHRHHNWPSNDQNPPPAGPHRPAGRPLLKGPMQHGEPPLHRSSPYAAPPRPQIPVTPSAHQGGDHHRHHGPPLN